MSIFSVTNSWLRPRPRCRGVRGAWAGCRGGGRGCSCGRLYTGGEQRIGLVACIGARYSLVCNKRINVKYLPRYCYNSSSQPPLARVTRIQSYIHCSWSSWWSPAYLGDGGVAGQCDVTQRCSFTSDRAMVDNSSLVMFSYTDLRLSDMPPKYLLGRRNTWLNFKRK